METIIFSKTTELRKNKVELEKKLNAKITIKGKLISFESKNSLDEYETHLVLDAMAMGFSTKKALLIKEPEMIFRKIGIKDFTRKKNLKEVRARIIGKQGKTIKTIRSLSNCQIVLMDNEIGIIGNAESIEITTIAITNLIRGTKQSNVYHYLEKSHKTKEEGLGLKD